MELSRLSLALLLAATTIVPNRAFAPYKTTLVPKALSSSSTSGGGDDEPTPSSPSKIKRDQEVHMEQVAFQGAEKIASMNISERTKRAMLAEVVEDQIFELSEALEALFDSDGQLPEANRNEAVDIARQTKSLQGQYDELVSGGPSSILQSLEAATRPFKDDK